MAVTIGMVRDKAIDAYARTGNRQSFPSIVRAVMEKDGDTPGTSIENRVIHDYLQKIPMREQELLQFLYRLPVNTQFLTVPKHLQVIPEESIVPISKNIAVHIHLPYIDDHTHTHNYFELNYIYSGTAEQIVDNETRYLNAGEICIISPNTKHNLLVNDTESLIISVPIRKSTFDSIFGNVMISNDLLAMFFKNTLYEKQQSRYLLFKAGQSDHEVIRLIQEIAVQSNSSLRYANLISESLVMHLFFYLMQRYSDTIIYYGEQEDQQFQSVFALILQYVQMHYSTITLRQLSDIFRYSEGYLSRMFKENMNESFSSLVQNLKVQNSLAYLQNTDLSIAEIAAAVGYTTPDSYRRSFEGTYHISPSSYRKKFRTSVRRDLM